MTRPSPESRAERLFAAWLEQREAGNPTSFAELLATAPDCQPLLRQLHCRWLQTDATLRRLARRRPAGETSAEPD